MWCGSLQWILKQMTNHFTADMLFLIGNVLTIQHDQSFVCKKGSCYRIKQR